MRRPTPRRHAPGCVELALAWFDVNPEVWLTWPSAGGVEPIREMKKRELAVRLSFRANGGIWRWAHHKASNRMPPPFTACPATPPPLTAKPVTCGPPPWKLTPRAITAAWPGGKEGREVGVGRIALLQHQAQPQDSEITYSKCRRDRYNFSRLFWPHDGSLPPAGDAQSF